MITTFVDEPDIAAAPLPQRVRYDAVLFDIGDTLIHFDVPYRRKLELFHEVQDRLHKELLRAGLTLPPLPHCKAVFRRRLITAFLWSQITGMELALAPLVQKCMKEWDLHLNDEQADDYTTHALMPLRGVVSLEPTAVETVYRLHEAGARLGIVSNTMFPRRLIDQALAEAGLLDCFPLRVYSAEVGYKKPHPRIFQIALAQLGVDAERAIFIGDRMDNDVRGAARLGMSTILFRRAGHSARRGLRPTHTVETLREVLPLLLD